MENVVGYIASDAFPEGYVAHSVQNMTIKNFLLARKKNLFLSWTEYKGQNGVVFESLLEENFYDGICFYTLEQLWHLKNPVKILEHLKKQNKWIGFAKENLYFQGELEFKNVLKIFWLKSQVEQKQALWEA